MVRPRKSGAFLTKEGKKSKIKKHKITKNLIKKTIK